MLEGLWIFVWSVIASVIKGQNAVGAWLFVVVPRVADAIDRVRTEREKLSEERDAFDEFAKRVASLDLKNQPLPAGSMTRSPASGPSVVTAVDQAGHNKNESTVTAETDSVATVHEAYCETVMTVPHYADEYDESLEENLAVELSPEVARALSESEAVTPQLQAAIIDQAQQASKQRKDLLTRVDAEYETLVAARRQLRELYETATTIEEDLYPRPVRELVQSWERLETKATDCEALLRERQNQIQSTKGTISVWSLQGYLYQPFQWCHPVLNDGLDTLSRIRHAKRTAVKAIYNW